MTDIKTTSGALVKHNGLMLAQPNGNALTIFDLHSRLYQATEQIGVFVEDKMLASLTLPELDDYQLKEGAYYSLGGCSSLKEFCETLVPVGSLVNSVKDILYYATRRGSKVILMVDREDDGFSSSLTQCCRHQGIYLTDIEIECRSGSAGIDSCLQFDRMLGRYLGNRDYQSVRLFSDKKEHLQDFLNTQAKYNEILFEGYWVGSGGSLSVMI